MVKWLSLGGVGEESPSALPLKASALGIAVVVVKEFCVKPVSASLLLDVLGAVFVATVVIDSCPFDGVRVVPALMPVAVPCVASEVTGVPLVDAKMSLVVDVLVEARFWESV